jgi:hypothetical protein
MREQFGELRSKINTVLAGEAPILDMKEQVVTRLSLEPGFTAYYRLSVRAKPSPVKFHIAVHSGLNRAELFLSSRIPRPNANNCEKHAPLKKKDMVVLFQCTNDSGPVFLEEYVYVSIRAEWDVTLTMDCCFGRSTLYIVKSPIDALFMHQQKSVDGRGKQERMQSQVASKIAIDQEIAALLEDGRSFAKLQREVALIKAKRRLRYFGSSGPIDFLNRNKERVRSLKSLAELHKPGDLNGRCNDALVKRDSREAADLRRKFLLAHKREINEKHACSERNNI